MRHRLFWAAGIVLAFALAGKGAVAEPAAPHSPQPPRIHHALFNRRHPNGTAGSQVPIPNAIIGNKRTHVYHLPGDTKNLPSPKNRVYFHSAAEAQAAGYHAAGQRHAGKSRTLTRGRHGHHPPNPTGSQQPAPPSSNH
jgi:hypothetical protein